MFGFVSTLFLSSSCLLSFVCCCTQCFHALFICALYLAPCSINIVRLCSILFHLICAAFLTCFSLSFLFTLPHASIICNLLHADSSPFSSSSLLFSALSLSISSCVWYLVTGLFLFCSSSLSHLLLAAILVIIGLFSPSLLIFHFVLFAFVSSCDHSVSSLHTLSISLIHSAAFSLFSMKSIIFADSTCALFMISVAILFTMPTYAFISPTLFFGG